MRVPVSLLILCSLSLSPEEKKNTPVRGNRSEEKSKQYYRSGWDPFLPVFLKIIFELVCLKTNQQKDGVRDKAFSDVCPFLKSDRAEQVKITVIIKALRKESRICVFIWGTFLLSCFFSFSHCVSVWVTLWREV